MPASARLAALLARARFFAIAMLGAYLLINLILALAAPIIHDWPLYGATAIAVPPMVIAMVQFVIPLARRFERG
jgi:hypothetical protein